MTDEELTNISRRAANAAKAYRKTASGCAAAEVCMDDVPRLIAALRAAQDRERWIPVGEKLPEDDATVAVYFVEKTVGTARLEQIGMTGPLFWCHWDWHRDVPVSEGYVTHWRPLPPLPVSAEGGATSSDSGGDASATSSARQETGT